jgi:hypothetical protein
MKLSDMKDIRSAKLEAAFAAPLEEMGCCCKGMEVDHHSMKAHNGKQRGKSNDCFSFLVYYKQIFLGTYLIICQFVIENQYMY